MSELDRVRGEHDLRREAPVAKRQMKQDSHGLLRLQRLAGNSAVSSLLVQRQDDPGVTSAPAQAGGEPMLMLVAMAKPGIINVTLKDGKVIDASAQLGKTD